MAWVRQYGPWRWSTPTGDVVNSDKMLQSLQYGKNFNNMAYNMVRISRVKIQEIWQLEEYFLQVLAVNCASAATEFERFRKVLSYLNLKLFENVCFMNDEKIPSDLGNLFQISHSREVSSWPLAVCSQCGLGGEVWRLFCIWLNFTWVDFWRIIIDALILFKVEIERANFACDFDFNRKQQTRLLEGEYECFFKLHKPITYQVNRTY